MAPAAAARSISRVPACCVCDSSVKTASAAAHTLRWQGAMPSKLEMQRTAADLVRRTRNTTPSPPAREESRMTSSGRGHRRGHLVAGSPARASGGLATLFLAATARSEAASQASHSHTRTASSPIRVSSMCSRARAWRCNLVRARAAEQAAKQSLAWLAGASKQPAQIRPSHGSLATQNCSCPKEHGVPLVAGVEATQRALPPLQRGLTALGRTTLVLSFPPAPRPRYSDPPGPLALTS